jgi:hypothetical protein
MIDTAEALYVLLTSDSTLAAFFTDSGGKLNIFGPPGLPDDFTVRKCLVFLGDGGPEDEYTPITREDFAFYTWAPTSDDARAGYQALAAFFRFKRHVRFTVGGQTVIFQKASRRTGPQDRVDFQDGWPFVYFVYNIHFVEVAVP